MTAVRSQTGRIGLGDRRVKKPSAKTLLAELRQMSRISQREEGLLNHSQAAAVLDVSTRRIGELVELGKLVRYDFLGRTYVSVREILERRGADVKAGRPPRSITQRIGTVAKVLTRYDPLNATIDAVIPEKKKARPRK